MTSNSYEDSTLALEVSVIEHMDSLEKAGLYLGEARGDDVLISATLLKTILVRVMTVAQIINNPEMNSGVALASEAVDAVIRTMALRELVVHPDMFDTPPET